ncbi:MurT ligase domain-containing protein [Peptococcaceae bacterium 1198_IL3148]
MGGKLSSRLSKFTGGRGSSLPGVVARRIYAKTLSELSKQVKKGTIMVTGTNGKTTTNNMLAKVLQADGQRVVFNEEGANLITGVTACFVRNATLSGVIDYDYAALEVDEASFPKVVKEVKPDMVVVNNFFRDQLDRYGELDKTVSLVRDALKQLDDVILVLNADDPLVAQLGPTTGHKAIYYGISQQQDVGRAAVQTREARFCPFCGGELDYNYYHYSQLGDYNCPRCNFARVTPEVEATDVEITLGGLTAQVCHQGSCSAITLHTAGFYNLYNALAAFAVGKLLAISVPTIQKGLEMYTPAIGRMERFRYHDKPALLNLVKNPTGFNEGLATLLSLPGSKDVFIALNDNAADGRDISWLWDVDFEILTEQLDYLQTFTCAGTRAEEMALRLKYAGVPVDKITVVRELESAITATLGGQADTAYLFSTYTALWPAQSILNRLAEKEETHAVGLSSVS